MSGETFDMVSSIVAIALLILCAFGMAVILFYVFSLKSVPIYKMRKRTFFMMIYDDFNTKNRVQLLFYTVFFFKRIIYAMDLVFLSDKKLIPLNVFIFIVTMIPMLYFSYAMPFKWILINALLCLNEFSETFVAIMLLHYQDAWLPDSEFFGYGKDDYNAFSSHNDSICDNMDFDKRAPLFASFDLCHPCNVLQHVYFPRCIHPKLNRYHSLDSERRKCRPRLPPQQANPNHLRKVK